MEGPLQKVFVDGSMAAAVGRMTEGSMSSAIVLALTDLCIAKDSSSYRGKVIILGQNFAGRGFICEMLY